MDENNAIHSRIVDETYDVYWSNIFFYDCKEYWNESELESALEPPHHMFLVQQICWSFVFSGLILTAVMGNIMVLWIVFAHRRMQTVTNLFIVSLGLADLMMAMLNCIFNVVYAINDNHWPLGLFCCKMNNFIANITVLTSVFSLVALSIDRYMVIVRPLKPRLSKKIARLMILFIWTASSIFSSPMWIFSEIISVDYQNGAVRTICFVHWPDGPSVYSTQDYIYNMAFLAVGYLLPMSWMSVGYTRISYVLWSKSVEEENERHAGSTMSKRKVVKMFIIMVALFAICWLPYHSYFIYHYFDEEFSRHPYVNHLYLAVYWLAMSNAMINPMLYYWMNPRFHHYFKNILDWKINFTNIRLSSLYRRPNLRSGRITTRSPFHLGEEFFHQYQCNNQRIRQQIRSLEHQCFDSPIHVVSHDSSSHEGHQRCQLFSRPRAICSSSTDSSGHQLSSNKQFENLRAPSSERVTNKKCYIDSSL
ncbi:tachykinin-like peptides receptor 86C isoform X2 [Artemia franciscana]|uniref:tachykinin-like peptides receptor 86C isoform X2 n=1 Tax=Artemia franciscana TaxID=6661 RepID=UPI0032DAEA4D